MVLIAVAVAVFGIRSVIHIQDSATTRRTGEVRPAVVDATGLGAALSVTYEVGPVRPAVVDATGLGAALSVTYEVGPVRPAILDATRLGAALSETYDAFSRGD